MANNIGYRKRYPILYCGLFGLFEDKKNPPRKADFSIYNYYGNDYSLFAEKKTDAVADYSLYYIRNSLSD